MFFALFHPPIHTALDPGEDRVLANFYPWSWGPAREVQESWGWVARLWMDPPDRDKDWEVLGAWSGPLPWVGPYEHESQPPC